MKELSIEEKARAYDEAIKYAHYLINERCKENTDGSFHRADLNKMFSELAESEDERIKKNIKIALMSMEDNLAAFYSTHRTSQKELLAWLEKQGKNNMGISEATKQKLEDNLNKALQKETPESCNEFLEKQGEQKPAWSEEDEKMMQYVIGSIDTNISDSNFKNIRTWFEALKERVQAQPKQEWSEEDEEEFQIAIDTLAEAGQNDSAHWFKSLRERYTWKPSDEQMNNK